MGMALDVHNAHGTWHLPVPATFVLDRYGVVRARHVARALARRRPGLAVRAVGGADTPA